MGRNKIGSHTNSPSCPSCYLKLCAIQSQIDRLEKILSLSKETLSFKEACFYTGLSSSQLYKLLKGRGLPYYKPNGKLIFFNRKELDNWLCSNNECIDLSVDTRSE